MNLGREPRNGFGYVYILSNPSMPRVFKIGLTTNTIGQRIRELSSTTGVPRQFVAQRVFEIEVRYLNEVERRAHKTLQAKGLHHGKEFFEGELTRCVEAVEDAVYQVTNAEATELVGMARQRAEQEERRLAAEAQKRIEESRRQIEAQRRADWERQQDAARKQRWADACDRANSIGLARRADYARKYGTAARAWGWYGVTVAVCSAPGLLRSDMLVGLFLGNLVGFFLFFYIWAARIKESQAEAIYSVQVLEKLATYIFHGQDYQQYLTDVERMATADRWDSVQPNGGADS
jgi:T5orf172 domain